VRIKNSVVLITGANRGIGLAMAREALARGARKVYAGARNPSTITLAGVVPVKLDVTDENDIAQAVKECADLTLLINNAGIAEPGSFLAQNALVSGLRHFETNFYGPWRLSAGFAPVLAANGGGAILNVLSVASWINSPMLAVYGASKSAAWALTNGLRNELRAQNTQVVGLHVGFVDTDLARGFDVQKTSPELVASHAFDGIEAGAHEVLADERSRKIKLGLSNDPGVYVTGA
jgi:NAD(P)-dependent dehydrogenase (short-subunit alcohol dehydrogenase family)